ncbi:MAG: DUF1571 domain-containing protein [Planctomycetota bacterium]
MHKSAGCILRAAVALVVLVVALVVIQKMITPADDPDITGPEVTRNQPRQNSSPGDSDSDPALLVPESSPTYGVTQQDIDSAEHPLLPVMEIARAIENHIDENVQDYSATITSQVRTDDGTTHPEKVCICKVRHETEDNGLSVYTKFLNPGSVAGQEAIWVGGRNDDKLIGHGTGLLNVKRMYLDPEGTLPMMGNRHPIFKLGLKNMIKELIATGEHDLEYEEIEVSIERGVEIDGQPCTMLRVEHPVERDHFEFHIANIYIDDALIMPVAFESYLWPAKLGGKPQLLERYYYTEIETNIGLADDDFDPGNEEYNYPAW